MRAHTGSRIAVNSQSIPDATKSWILADSPLLCAVPARDSEKGQNRASLGGHLDVCSKCGLETGISFNSCLMGSFLLWGVRR
jgi:hypothetical protein